MQPSFPVGGGETGCEPEMREGFQLASLEEKKRGRPWWLSGKESTCQTGDAGSLPREEMATHSSILAWRIPWTEESGRLQSMGSQKVGHDLETKQ